MLLDNCGARLSKDKIPYGLGLFCGVHTFSKEKLVMYRKAVDKESRGEELSQLMAAIKTTGCQIGGDQYKRVPTGFEPEHPRADLLKNKDLHASISDLDPELITKSE